MALRIVRTSRNAINQMCRRNYSANVTAAIDETQLKSPLQKKNITAIPAALFGGRHAASMLPGGGIGPELMQHVREVFAAIGVPVDFEIIDIDPNKEGNDDLDYAIMSIKRNGVALKGNIETSSEGTDTVSRNVALRNELDLFVNVVECKQYPGVPARHKDVNIAIVRQNTEGEFAKCC